MRRIPRTSRSLALRKALLIGVGGLALGLGLLGVVLPGLPTTPFVLLAAACFAKASPRLHRRIVGNPLLGPMVRDWEAHRSLPVKIKLIAIGSMTLMVGLSVWHFAGRPGLQAALVVLGVIGAVVVGRIPARR
ncbi:YbaN family protein [Zoogloea sp.]|jgi:hypothetical protein|uniref:YbaN family protein n=1 Tax=Zoogloea sp. TaxID=49181 RepID=UPI0035AE0CA2